ncbi:MAG TPA: branched-chain amino acid ABC transporter permease [Syntrophorhabdaceae bacterium]|nr:branched-chain amino acid ABC transporter permease [Syntrophorhabdaceae bacterium]HOL04961.1 branched-chain amino acid ABC transporter permease [Syntrophorhabdaceae bacterium]HON85207.1 branched-chain amino acid ABC transporter permease [Syntrophorhabdaceae bacterium]HOT42004.1 branched-chain amino acid ABC transporter permease [Syntrophorhabdaceae bacterium]HPC66547.1 branched-chain amino acid ABC transporter permease [Syntrophorhabdaceae bacterium]
MFVYGLINSAVLALMAIGFNLTFGISGVANFAYGAIYVVSGFLTWSLINKLNMPYPVSAISTIIIIGILGALIYRFIIKRIRGLVISEVIATFGISIVILEFLRYVGFIGFKYSLPMFITGSVEIFDAYVDIQRLLIICFVILLIIALYIFTHHTKIGRAFRGIAQEEHTSLSLGINPDWIASLSMGLGSSLGAFAAIVILPLGTITVDGGYDVLINALSVCIVGGLGSTFGIIIASVIIGYAQTLTATYLAPHWTMIVSLLAILIILVFKPSGILGHQKELEERV